MNIQNSPIPKGRGRPPKSVQKIGNLIKGSEKSNQATSQKTRATKGKTRATKGKTSSFSSKSKNEFQNNNEVRRIKPIVVSPNIKNRKQEDDDESNAGEERESQEDYRYEEEEDEEYYDEDEDVELVGEEEDDLDEEDDLRDNLDNSASLTNSNLKIKIKLSSSNPNLNLPNQNLNLSEPNFNVNNQNLRTLKMINLNSNFQIISQHFKESSLLRFAATEPAQNHYPLESFNLKQLVTLKDQFKNIKETIEKLSSNVSNQLLKIENLSKMNENKVFEEINEENKIVLLKEEDYDSKGIDLTSNQSISSKQQRKRQRGGNEPNNFPSQQQQITNPYLSSQIPKLPNNTNISSHQPSLPLSSNAPSSSLPSQHLPFQPSFPSTSLKNSNNNLHLSSSSSSLPSSFLKKENEDILSSNNEMMLNDMDDDKNLKKARISETKKKKKAARGRTKQMRKKKKGERNKNNNNNDDDFSYLDEMDEEDTKKGGVGYYNHTYFWNHMKPYVTPITNEHLNFLQPTDPNNDPIFEIPTPGIKSNKEKKIVNRNSTTGMKTTITSSTANKIKLPSSSNQPPNPENIDCGELTSRIFSSLVQEKIIPETKKKLKYRFKKSELFQDYPVPYSEKTIETIEERIRNELSEIGLIDNFSTPISSSSSSSNLNNNNNINSSSSNIVVNPINTGILDNQDDEIITELKDLQQKLLQQININNQNKKEILQLATVHMRREQQLELIQKERANVEKIFSNAFPKIKKKKK